MANTIEVIVTASDKASPALKGLNTALDGTASAAAAAATAWDKTAAIAHRLELSTLQLARAQAQLATETDPMRQAQLRVEIDNLAKSQDSLQSELKQSADSTDDLNDSLEKTDDAANEADSGLTRMMNVLKAAGVVAAAIKFGKMAVEMGELGAAAQRTEQGFTAISGGASAASANLDAMMRATSGAIDRTTAMSMASQMLQMGIAKNSDELARNAEMATRLGRAMGVDATTAMQNWNAMIANQSLPRLDTFGISSGRVRTKIEELMAATEGLTREQAFSIAVMEEGAVAMDRLGDAAEDNALKIEQSKAALVDLKAEIGMKFTEVVAGSESAIGKFTRQWGDNLRAMRDSGGEIGAVEANIGMLRDALGATNTVFDKYRQAQRAASAETARYTGQAEAYARAMADSVVPAIEDAYDGTFDLYWRMRDLETVSLGLEDVTYSSADAFRDYQSAVDGANASNQQFDTGNAQSELDAVADAAMSAQEQVDLISWGTEQTFTEQIDDAKTRIGELRDKAGELQAKIAELEGLQYRTPAQDAELAGLRDQLSGVNGDIQDVIDKTDEMVKTFILGMVEMQIAADQDITPEESDFYVRLAAQFGLVDDAAIEMRGTVLSVLEDVTAGTISPEEGIKAIGDAATDAIDPLTTLAEEGGTALADLGIDADAARNQIADLGKEGPGAIGAITTAAGGAAGELQRAAGQAGGLKAALDLLTDKEIKVTTIFTEEHRAVGGPAPAPVQFQATGGDYFVNRPTPFIAGEAGPERAIFIPQGQPGYDADWGALLAPLGRPADTASASSSAGAIAAMQSYNQSRNVTLINPIFQGSQLASLRALAQMEF